MKVTRTDGNGLPSPVSIALSKVSSGRALKAALWPATWSLPDCCLHLMKQRSDFLKPPFEFLPSCLDKGRRVPVTPLTGGQRAVHTTNILADSGSCRLATRGPWAES